MSMMTCYDTQSCIRCFSCAVNCSVENRTRLQRDKGVDVARSVNEKYPHLAYLSPVRKQIGEYPNAKEITELKHCRHCEKAKCMDMCPAGAITKTRNGSVVINEKACVGCRACQDGCPYDVPQFSPQTGKTYKCIQCYDRVGSGLKPACVEACPTGAMFSGRAEEVLAEAKNRAERYSKLTGKPYIVYGASAINGFVGKANWVTIAPEEDRNLYGLPADPYKASVGIRSFAKKGGGVLAAASLIGVVGHFFYWLANRKKAVAAEEGSDA